MIKEPAVELITGEEFGEQRRKFLKKGLRRDSPEMRALWNRVIERDEYLWERYAKPLIKTHKDQWAAVSLSGQAIIKNTASEIMEAATNEFGAGNFAYGKLAEFRG